MLSAEGPQTTFLKHLTVAARARLVKLGLEPRLQRAGEGRRLLQVWRPCGRLGAQGCKSVQQARFKAPSLGILVSAAQEPALRIQSCSAL
ncbi:unnamed protein product [Rangifer tarandus platyrhynchus]|uniref:Uncharacterized protein n=1 Tax=Rangifer tarandus platyrhynchus TaxID=3082113 RepID=A0AC60A9J5_RANTA